QANELVEPWVPGFVSTTGVKNGLFLSQKDDPTNTVGTVLARRRRLKVLSLLCNRYVLHCSDCEKRKLLAFQRHLAFDLTQLRDLYLRHQCLDSKHHHRSALPKQGPILNELFSSSNAFCCSGPQVNRTPFLAKRCKGAAM